MTGFARASDELDDWYWTWELKSVNGRSLDIRVKVPFGYERIELPARKIATTYLRRGSVSLAFVIGANNSNNTIRINRPLLEELITLHGELSGQAAGKQPNIETLLTVKGIVETTNLEAQKETTELLDAAILNTLDEAIKELSTSRQKEGEQISACLDDCLSSLEALCHRARQLDATRLDFIRNRLNKQISDILEQHQEISEERLAQEVALLATKSDVREELDRLEAHCEAGRELLAENGSIGRKLDFLCQELNREANTLCAKSASEKLTRIGLKMKAAIDQLREQAQNVE